MTPDGVETGDGAFVPARTVVWGAGITAVPLAAALGVETTRGGRVVVDETLRVPGRAGRVRRRRPGRRVGRRRGALPAGGAGRDPAGAARRPRDPRLGGRRARRPFRYRDPGMMATIGRNAAILQLPTGFTMRGFVAWLGWLVVHVLALAGFRNRIAVLFSWVWNYVTYDRGPRLILGPPVRLSHSTPPR